MRWLAVFLACALVLPLVAADMNTTGLAVSVRLRSGTVASGVAADDLNFFNASLTTGASYQSATFTAPNGKTLGTVPFVNLTASTASLRFNVSSAASLAFASSIESQNRSFGLWMFFNADDGTNDFINKHGAGTPAFTCYVQWSSSNNIRCDTWNATGANEFPSAGIGPTPGRWTLFVLTSNQNYNLVPYLCEAGNTTVRQGSTMTASGGMLRNASADARIFGSDGSAPINGSVGGFRFFNRTLSFADVEEMCALGPNFDDDNVSVSVNWSGSNGTWSSSMAPNPHTWMLANVTATNIHPARVDSNNDGSEDTNVSQAQVDTMRALGVNVTSVILPGGQCAYRTEMSLESTSTALGTWAYTQSNYANTRGHRSQNEYIASLGCLNIITSGYMPSWLSNTSSGWGTSTARNPPTNFTAWGEINRQYLYEVRCHELGNCRLQYGNEASLFWFNNVSNKQNATVVAAYIAMMNATYNAVCADANLSYMCNTSYYPSFETTRDATSDYWRRAIFGNFTSRMLPSLSMYGQGAWGTSTATDYYEIAASDYAELVSDCAIAGCNASDFHVAELGHYLAGDTNGTNGTAGYARQTVQVSSFLHFWLDRPSVRARMNFFEFSDLNNLTSTGANPGRDMRAVVHPAIAGVTSVYRPIYWTLWRFRFHATGSEVKPCSVGDPYLYCAATSGQGYRTVTITNTARTPKNVSLAISGGSWVSARNIESGATFEVSGGSATLTDLAGFDSNTYALVPANISFSSTTPVSATPSATEPSSTAFSYVLTNPAGIETASTWRVNGSVVASNSTNYTLPGNFTSAGVWVVNVSVTSEANNVSYQWTLTVTDASPLSISSSVVNSTTNDSLGRVEFWTTPTNAGAGNVTIQHQVWRNGSLFAVWNLTEAPGASCVVRAPNATSSCYVGNGSVTVVGDYIASPGSVTASYPFSPNAGAYVVRSLIGLEPVATSVLPAACVSTSGVRIIATSEGRVSSGESAVYCAGTSGNVLLVNSSFSSSSTVSGGAQDDGVNALFDGNESSRNHFRGGLYWALNGPTISTERASYLYELNATYALGFAPNSSRLVYGVGSGLVKGQTWVLSSRAYDGSSFSAWANSSTFTVGNAVPNATNVAASAIAGGLNCTYVYADHDGDAESGSTYRWFRNGTALVPVTRTLGSGNYSLSDLVVCEVTPRDGTSFGSAANSSAYVAGDSTPPTVSSVSVPSVATTSDLVRVSAVCTDDYSVASGGVTVSWVAPNGTREANRTMTLLSGSTYFLDWVYLSSGYYTGFTVSCVDGSGNRASLATSSTLAVTTVASGGGGGGGGGVVVVTASGVEIVKPAARRYSVSCGAGDIVDDWEVQLYNPTGSDATYSFRTEGVKCSAVPDVSIPAKSTRSVFVSGCECGEQGETVKGSLDIYDARAPGVVAASLPITFAESILSVLLAPGFVFAMVVGVGLVILFIALGVRR